MTKLRLSQDPGADAFLSKDSLALLVGMVLDQQVTMEWAFTAPYVLAQRLNVDHLDATVIADANPDQLAEVFAQRPALHRFSGAMAKRVQAVCGYLVENYDGDVEKLWQTASTGAELSQRLRALPGFGAQKAAIFLALLGKQLDVQPDGWREAAGVYGEEGSYRSVADITGPESLAKVREHKRAMKQEAKHASTKTATRQAKS